MDLIILFLIAVSFWGYKGGRNIIVGICLALAAMIKLSPAILLIYMLWKRELSIIVSAVVTLLLSAILSWLVVGREAILFFGTTILPGLLKGSYFYQNQSLNGFFSRLFIDSGLFYSLEESPSIPQARALTALASLVLIGVGAFVARKRISRKSLRSDLEFSLAIVIMLLVSSISWEHYFSWLLVPFLVLLNPESRNHLTPRKHLCVIAAAFLAYLTTIVPSSLYGMTLHSSTATYPVELGLTLLLSLGVYGALLLYSIFAYLIARLPPGDSREAAWWARAETRATSL